MSPRALAVLVGVLVLVAACSATPSTGPDPAAASGVERLTDGRPAAHCGLSGSLLAEATADPTAVDFDADLAVARDIAATCARTLGGLTPHLGTVNVARDVDVLRAALGEARLSFSGISYGTSLGTAYASLFPDHADRVLLDSRDDDTLGWRERFRLSNAAVDARFADVATAISADRRWGFGSAEDVRARYLDVQARATRAELRLDGTPVTVRGLRSVVDDALRRGGEPRLSTARAGFATPSGRARSWVTTGDGGHGVLGRNRCATDSAVAWLVDGALPAGDTDC